MYRGSVYLAGPIRNMKDYDAANDWRNQMEYLLMGRNIETYSPLRAHRFLSENWRSLADGDGSDPSNVLTTGAAIVERDRFDVLRCDVMVANFLGAGRDASLGTAIEFGWADANRIPIVLVIEDEGNVHDHAMITRLAGWRTNNVEEAVHIIDSIL